MSKTLLQHFDPGSPSQVHRLFSFKKRMATFAFVTTAAPFLGTVVEGRTTASSTKLKKPPTLRRCRSNRAIPRASTKTPNAQDFDKNDFASIVQDFLFSLAGVYAAASSAPAFAIPESLVETFKSIPASLAHPTLMWLLFGTCAYAFYLGYQSRQIRSAEPERRKELIKSGVTEKHYKTASSLFAIMTIATFTGMANTFARTGKLFPGPHLYAGLGLVATMAVMQSFVPYMQKGKDWARQAHFSMAFFALGLFGWQAKSGMDIVAKLLKWE